MNFRKNATPPLKPWSRPWLMDKCRRGEIDGFIRIDALRVAAVMQPAVPQTREELAAGIRAVYGIEPLEIYLHREELPH